MQNLLPTDLVHLIFFQDALAVPPGFTTHPSTVNWPFHLVPFETLSSLPFPHFEFHLSRTRWLYLQLEI